MSGYLSLEHFSPSLNIIVGILSALGALGLGLMVQKSLLKSLPTPWSEVTSAILGFQIIGFSVEVVLMLGAGSRSTLTSIWLASLILGALGLWSYRTTVSSFFSPLFFPAQSPWINLIFWVAILGLLAMAASPCTKTDEMQYHMFMTARLVADKALVFYREPWLASVLSQMRYTIGQAPLHALGFPAAGNIESWSLALIFFSFILNLMLQAGRSVTWSRFVCLSIAIGMYPAVHYVTGGAHGYGDLATCAAVTLMASFRRLEKCGTPILAASVSILAVASASTKISLLPFAAAATLFSLVYLSRMSETKSRLVVIASALLPWLILYLPILIWTHYASGSPFGPIMAGKLGWSIYDVQTIQSSILASSKANRSFSAFITMLRHVPLTYTAVFVVFLFSAISSGFRLIIPKLFFLLQVAIIMFAVTFDPRFLGGTQYALVVLWAANATSWDEIFSRSSGWRLATILSFLPWIAFQLYYTSPFLKFDLGITSKEAFYQRYIAFFDDFRKLDELLPKDAVLAFDYPIAFSSLYAPRSLYLDLADVPNGRNTYYIFLENDEKAVEKKLHKKGFTISRAVYSNPNAICTTTRSPGRENTLCPMYVFQIEKDLAGLEAASPQ